MHLWKMFKVRNAVMSVICKHFACFVFILNFYICKICYTNRHYSLCSLMSLYVEHFADDYAWCKEINIHRKDACMADEYLL